MAIKHGLRHHALYRKWSNIIDRCYNPNNRSFARYGGRGIVMCDRWRHSVANFINDIGVSPNKAFHLDRIDNNGPYSPENTRWASSSENCRNKNNNRILTAFGKTMCLTSWAEELRMNPKTIRSRIKMGWSLEDTLSLPKQTKWTRQKKM